jgi:hypothetical protein
MGAPWDQPNQASPSRKTTVQSDADQKLTSAVIFAAPGSKRVPNKAADRHVGMVSSGRGWWRKSALPPSTHWPARARVRAFRIGAQNVLTMRSEVANQVIASATKPEQSSTRPAMATARKLLEANSSRMVHHLIVRPCPNRTTLALHSQKNSIRGAISIPADDFRQHCFAKRANLHTAPGGPAAGKSSARCVAGNHQRACKITPASEFL